MRKERLEAGQKIRHRIFGFHDFRSAEIQANGNFGPVAVGPQSTELSGNDGGSFVIEAQPIDQRVVLGKTIKPRLGIPRLCLGGNCANFHKSETERGNRFRSARVFVKTAGKPNGIGKL